MSKKAIALFSGGLDSILACRLMASQGVDVLAVKFVSPFFCYDFLEDPDHCRKVKEKYGINLVLRDISDEYMLMLKNPAHGYGKHFNPCLDCKIFMMTRAREMMAEVGASFLISGEVIGQRPMSQRRDAMRVVERDSGCDGILLRPLCAQRLNETKPEIDGVVDRTKLAGLSGRGRTGQMELAASFGITDYPTPAGGCILTDPIVGERIKQFYQSHDKITVADIRLLIQGRQFTLPDGSWLVIGRKAAENPLLENLLEPDDLCLVLKDRIGPTAVLRNLQSRHDLEIAAGLVARYAKKGPDGRPVPGVVLCRGKNGVEEVNGVPVL
jgi:tRNA U34 2-thiouridine synthase MnmA/TrmU